MKRNNPDKRVYYLDYLRILATFAVMIEHNSVPFFMRSVHSADWKISNTFESLIRWCVPMFMMISGTLFLGRDITVKKLYSKYVIRMIIAYFVWSLFYTIVARNPAQSVWEQFLMGHYHMWFIRMTIVIYVFMPFLKWISQNTRVMKMFLITILGIVIMCAQIACLIGDFGDPELVNSHLLLKMLYGLRDSIIYVYINYSAYFVLGYYLSKTEIPKAVRYVLYVIGVFSVFVTYKIEYAYVLSLGHQSELYYDPTNIHMLFITTALFVLYRNLPLPECNIIKILSICSFGAYWIHPFIIQLLDMIGINAGKYFPLVGIFVIGSMVSIISFGVSFVLNKIPGVRDYLV
ncbi:acyltransferase [Butyrivibrio sp. FCS006]|uniref:acyltransferase n=1 Tax=Butyrivibrio sp. FCS006 TaxID=1280684 RepID=UPI0004211C6A|nr:acyltransferase family protein [Butyrivibrio sp. FCS006]